MVTTRDTHYPDVTDRWQHTHWEEPDWLWQAALSVACILQCLLPVIIWYALHRMESKSEEKIDEDYQFNLNVASCLMEGQIRDLGPKGKMPPDEYERKIAALLAEYKSTVQDVTNKKQEQEASRKVKNISCCRIFSVVLQISLWFWLLYVVLATVTCSVGFRVSNCGQISTTLAILVSFGSIFSAVSYFYVLLESIPCRERKYLSRLRKAGNAGKYITLLRRTAPNVVMTAVCYHYETRTRIVYHTDGNGNTSSHTETYTVRVDTATDADVFVYNYWVDKSEGQLGLDTKYGVTKIKLRRGSRIFERGGVQARIQDFSQAPPPWTLSA